MKNRILYLVTFFVFLGIVFTQFVGKQPTASAQSTVALTKNPLSSMYLDDLSSWNAKRIAKNIPFTCVDNKYYVYIPKVQGLKCDYMYFLRNGNVLSKTEMLNVTHTSISNLAENPKRFKITLHRYQLHLQKNEQVLFFITYNGQTSEHRFTAR